MCWLQLSRLPALPRICLATKLSTVSNERIMSSDLILDRIESYQMILMCSRGNQVLWRRWSVLPLCQRCFRDASGQQPTSISYRSIFDDASFYANIFFAHSGVSTKAWRRRIAMLLTPWILETSRRWSWFRMELLFSPEAWACHVCGQRREASASVLGVTALSSMTWRSRNCSLRVVRLCQTPVPIRSKCLTPTPCCLTWRVSKLAPYHCGCSC